MNTYRMTATIVGVLYIIGTAAGMASAVVATPVLNSAEPLAGIAGNGNQLVTGALLVLVMGLALAMVPAMMFPILKRRSEAFAIGYVIFRGALEAFSYLALVLCWLVLVVISGQSADAGAAVASQFGSLGILLVKAQDPIIAVGDIVFGIGALMFACLLYQMRLIPRWISGWGILAAVAYAAAGLTAMFGTTLELLLMPMLVQEMVMAVWLIVKGFNPSAVTIDSTRADVTRYQFAAQQ